jgi:hypothetical protein
MAGHTSLSLNRPKYLSDQLFNKVLLNNLFFPAADMGVLGVGHPPLDATRDRKRDLTEARRVFSTKSGIFRNVGIEVMKDAFGAVVPVVDDNIEPLLFGIHSGSLSTNAVATTNITGDTKLNYLKKDGTLKQVDLNQGGRLSNANAASLAGYEGYLRYQSRVVRWIDWFCQLQRCLRLLMRSQLEWVEDPVVKGYPSIVEDVTEFKNNNVFNIEDFE